MLGATGSATSSPSFPPGPAVHRVVQVLRWLRRPIEFLEECARRYGDAFTIQLAGATPLVLFSHPGAIREILSADADESRAGEANAPLAPIFGHHSLLLLDGEHHRRVRRLVAPPFHGERVHAYGTMMRATVDRAIDSWPLGQSFSLHEAMQAVSLDVILETVLGPGDAAVRKRLRPLILRLLEVTAQPFVRGPWWSSRRGVGKRWWAIAHARGDLDAVLTELIETRRSHDPRPHDDLLGLLMAAHDETGYPLTVEELCDQLVTLLVSGHETTATTLAWVFHHLLAQREVLVRLGAELSATQTRPNEAPYLEAVIRETLRLNPAFVIIGRRLKHPTVVWGYALPAGTIVAPCIYLAHRRPDIWPMPQHFHPDRFLTARPLPYEFLPFGGGSRRCLGTAFALHEMRIVIEQIVRRTRLHAASLAIEPMVRRNIGFAPGGGVRVVLDERLGDPCFSSPVTYVTCPEGQPT